MIDTRADFNLGNQFRLLSGNPAACAAGDFAPNLKFAGGRMIVVTCQLSDKLSASGVKKQVIKMLKSADDLIREAQRHIECVDVKTAKKIYDESPDAVIVDVREAHKADESKLTNSINISRGVLEYDVHKECPDANTVIITHCGGGGRASLAAHSLKQLGYNRVYAITAPFDEIKQVFG